MANKSIMLVGGVHTSFLAVIASCIGDFFMSEFQTPSWRVAASGNAPTYPRISVTTRRQRGFTAFKAANVNRNLGGYIMTNLIPVNFQSNQVRIVEYQETLWFVAADVCAILNLKNPSMAVANLDDDERSKFNLGRQGEATIISESGLYALIFRSRKSVAKVFRKWVTSEVLPSIRKTGSYGTTQAPALPIEWRDCVHDAYYLNKTIQEQIEHLLGRGGTPDYYNQCFFKIYALIKSLQDTLNEARNKPWR